MGIALEICNKVMSEVQGIKDTGFPLDAFPERVQTIILDMVRYENFKVEYLAPAMLSAVSSALGGTYYVRVKGQWITNAAHGSGSPLPAGSAHSDNSAPSFWKAF